MFRNTNYNKKVILKRKDEEEKNSNYTKIYDLSELDKIPNIDTEEKYNLLKFHLIIFLNKRIYEY